MKITYKILLLSVIILTSCGGKKPYTQRIKSASDCSYCHSNWSWNNGMASIKEEAGGFSFVTNVSGDLSFSYKIIYDYGTGSIRVGGRGVSFNDNEETGWKHVNTGHVDAETIISVFGNRCSIKDIKIKGYLEDEEPEPSAPSEPQNPENPWDF